ncbi:hypothetical protein FOG51_02491 [Hanseniaspora uvarum]|nr:hypothetical protein FOG48_02155 [Hanseniaspora uvarum]KAF0272767.1 hypothetical protein FOG51_02491 [Hanseniaspora uvarum]KAF0275330.1 hypothetical protein FOG50_03839 [Hanseniaspora uvarum]
MAVTCLSIQNARDNCIIKNNKQQRVLNKTKHKKMNGDDVSQSITLLERGLLEIEDILAKRKEESLNIAVQELKNVLNDSEKDDVTTPFEIDPRSIDILLKEYNEEIIKLKQKYITSGSLENMLERIFNMTGYEDELEQLKNTEVFMQDSLKNETEILEKNLNEKIEKSFDILNNIKKKNDVNFNNKEKEIVQVINKIKQQLQEKEVILEDFNTTIDGQVNHKKHSEVDTLLNNLIRK